MRSEGFLFLTGGSGGGTVFVSILGMRPRAFAVCPMRCALIGLAWTGVAWAEPCVAVPWGLVLGVSFPMRCAVVICGESVVWVAVCRWDWQGERCVGGAVVLGLVERASRE